MSELVVSEEFIKFINRKDPIPELPHDFDKYWLFSILMRNNGQKVDIEKGPIGSLGIVFEHFKRYIHQSVDSKEIVSPKERAEKYNLYAEEKFGGWSNAFTLYVNSFLEAGKTLPEGLVWDRFVPAKDIWTHYQADYLAVQDFFSPS